MAPIRGLDNSVDSYQLSRGLFPVSFYEARRYPVTVGTVTVTAGAL